MRLLRLVSYSRCAGSVNFLALLALCVCASRVMPAIGTPHPHLFPPSTCSAGQGTSSNEKDAGVKWMEVGGGAGRRDGWLSPRMGRVVRALLLGIAVSVVVTVVSRIGVLSGWETRAVDAFLFFRDQVRA